MKVLIFGASGMIGHGVLRECLLAPDVEQVVAIGRCPLGREDAKLREIIHADFTDFTPIASQLAGFDACFFCLGVSSAGMSEADYTRVTYDYALAAARVVVSPDLVFTFITGAGTDEHGRSMWARVKGRAENALLAMPFKAAYMFRPAGIQPMHGARSKTRSYRIGYTIAWPLLPLLRVLLPGTMTTTERIGRAMLVCARTGAPKPILESRDINQLARA